MSTLLIPTFVDDLHAYAVAVVLEQMGHRPVLWHCSDMPERSAASVLLEAGQSPRLHLYLHGAMIDMSLDEVDVFWHRRIGSPVVTTELLACDRSIVINENERFVRSLLAQLSHGRFAVNDFQAARCAEDKVLQLAAAQRIGFELPDTLVSNDPATIRSFIARHEAEGVVVKNFSPMGWQGEDKVLVNFTAPVTAAQLPRDPMLRLTPSIYQRYVPKAYEVRVTCMGGEQIAAALHSQQNEESRVDWRTVVPQTLAIERIDMPPAVAQRCARYMADLGLHFGAFDFIVTPEGRWVFLELNQMGQFLWLEEANGELPLLQMFCDFLVSKDPAFRYSRRGHGTGYRDIYDETCERLRQAAATHLHPAMPPNVYAEPGGRTDSTLMFAPA